MFATLRPVISRKLLKLRMRALRKLGRWSVSPLSECDIKYIPVYCINLESAVARRALMLRQAVSLGLTNFSFVDAVSATKLDLHQLQQDGDYDEAAAIKLHGRPLTRGEIACSLSHGQVYERILAEGHPFALVLEDDALFISHRLQRVRLADFPIGIDVIFLNFFRSVEPPRGRISGSIFSDASYEGSSAAYIVTRSGAEKLARAYRPVVHAADGLLGRSLAHLDGRAAVFPPARHLHRNCRLPRLSRLRPKRIGSTICADNPGA